MKWLSISPLFYYGGAVVQPSTFWRKGGDGYGYKEKVTIIYSHLSVVIWFLGCLFLDWVVSSRRLEFYMRDVFGFSVIPLFSQLACSLRRWIGGSCGFLAPLVCSVLISTPDCFADSGKIYVIREKNGVVRFTNKAPAQGVNARIFTARGGSYTTYSFSGRHTGKIYPERYQDIIAHASRLHSVDAGLIKAVIHAESAFNPSARSPKGAQGLMQLMPGTARDLGVNAWHPNSNILGGTRYLARLLKKFDGNERHALAAYNAGEENVTKYNGIPPFAETQHYVKRVLQLKRRYSATAHG